MIFFVFVWQKRWMGLYIGEWSSLRVFDQWKRIWLFPSMKLGAAWRRSTAAAAESDAGTHGSLSTANRFEAEAYIRVYICIFLSISISMRLLPIKNRKQDRNTEIRSRRELKREGGVFLQSSGLGSLWINLLFFINITFFCSTNKFIRE